MSDTMLRKTIGVFAIIMVIGIAIGVFGGSKTFVEILGLPLGSIECTLGEECNSNHIGIRFKIICAPKTLSDMLCTIRSGEFAINLVAQMIALISFLIIIVANLKLKNK